MKPGNIHEIVLDRDEIYDAKELNCWPFCSQEDTKNGIKLELGNMIGGFQINVDGKVYHASEVLYLCGQFSLKGKEYANIRDELRTFNDGFRAKKLVKNKHKDMIRLDFSQFSTQWMLWVVWQKTVQNPRFSDLLLRIPEDAIIIEDSTSQNGITAKLWGTKNSERRKEKKALKKELMTKCRNDFRTETAFKVFVREEQCKIEKVGVFEGKNNMGKILMLCKRALENKKTPDIDYELLRASKIYLNDDAPLLFEDGK